ncbi:MAG: dTMP kinase [Nanoarchaeota archaeon]|nr:dTMP kinase [Nanoarchaeota archaeon]
MIVSFEGNKGAGKTSRITDLKEMLTNHGFESSAPRTIFSDSPIGQSLQDIFNNAYISFEGLSETCLVIADLTYIVNQEIKKNNEIYLLDRYLDTTRAIQTLRLMDDYNMKQHESLGIIDRLQNHLPKPDLTVFLDIPYSEAILRMKKRGTKFSNPNIEERIGGREEDLSKKEQEMFDRINCIYRYLTTIEADRFLHLDAREDPHTTNQAIYCTILNEYLRINSGD